MDSIFLHHWVLRVQNVYHNADLPEEEDED